MSGLVPGTLIALRPGESLCLIEERSEEVPLFTMFGRAYHAPIEDEI